MTAQRMSRRRWGAVLDMLDRGIDDLVYNTSQDARGVDITLGDDAIREYIAENKDDDSDEIGIYYVEDVWSAVERYRAASEAQAVLLARFYPPKEHP